MTTDTVELAGFLFMDMTQRRSSGMRHLHISINQTMVQAISSNLNAVNYQTNTYAFIANQHMYMNTEYKRKLNYLSYISGYVVTQEIYNCCIVSDQG